MDGQTHVHTATQRALDSVAAWQSPFPAPWRALFSAQGCLCSGSILNKREQTERDRRQDCTPCAFPPACAPGLKINEVAWRRVKCSEKNTKRLFTISPHGCQKVDRKIHRRVSSGSITTERTSGLLPPDTRTHAELCPLLAFSTGPLQPPSATFPPKHWHPPVRTGLWDPRKSTGNHLPLMV